MVFVVESARGHEGKQRGERRMKLRPRVGQLLYNLPHQPDCMVRGRVEMKRGREDIPVQIPRR